MQSFQGMLTTEHIEMIANQLGDLQILLEFIQLGDLQILLEFILASVEPFKKLH